MVDAPVVAASDFLRINIADGEPDKAIVELLEHAAKFGFSDVFFATNENHVALLARHLGILRRVSMLSLDMGRRCISSIKARAGMDVAERRRPQDGRWLHESDGQVIDLRLNAIPTLYGEDLSLRLLIRDSQLLNIDSLGLDTNELNSLLGLLNSPSGLILVTGPTGAGKTTTLYACLNYLNNDVRKIHTIEDPIEYTLPGVRQSQVNSIIDVGFSELLRSVLRQAPDVIMIGEIRDAQTAEIAVRAANSGHLVLATMHAPVAVGAIQTMLNLGVSPAFLASSLHGVIAQRLVRTLCPSCKTVFDLGGVTGLFDSVRHWLGPSEGVVIHGPGKCDVCCQSGYKGRTGVFELLKINREIRKRIAEQRPFHELKEQAIANGLIQCQQTALLKVARGETSIEEVMRAIPAEHLGLEE